MTGRSSLEIQVTGPELGRQLDTLDPLLFTSLSTGLQLQKERGH